MLPWHRARDLYETQSGESFWVLLGHYLEVGLVHSTPGVFLLARPLCWQGREIQGPPNAWFIHLAASATGARYPMRECMGALTFPLPFLIWQRSLGRPGNHFHVHRWDHLAKRLGFHGSTF